MRKLVMLGCLFSAQLSFSLPSGFVYLKDIAPDLEQEMRYATNDNFVGRPIVGYQAGVCILSKQAAYALKHAQKIAESYGYGLKVYDCYRPQRAVEDFYRWSQKRQSKAFNESFYPRIRKSQLFHKGYIARYSGHSRGSTVDLTLVPAKPHKLKRHHQTIERCYASTPDYLTDNSIDMGTRFDCLDPSAHYRFTKLSKLQISNRKLLRKIMRQAGFKPYYKEWWHFTLSKEPFPKKYFNFIVS